MRIATWNVNSIRARTPKLTGWLQEAKPDVLLLQETKVEDSGFPTALFTDLGYQVSFHGQKSYNGVAIAARSAITDVALGLELEPGKLDEQTRVIAATVDGLRVASIYAPNGQSPGTDKYGYKLAWYAALRRWLDAHDRAQPIVLGGDWNVAPGDLDVYDPKKWAGKIMCSEPERDGWRALCAWGLDDAFRRLNPESTAYSWWDYRGAWFWKDQGLRIDHFLADPTVMARVTACAIDRDARKGQDASDHAPVVLTLGQ